MADRRRGYRSLHRRRGRITPLRIGLVAVAVVATVLGVALLVPESPLGTNSAARWGDDQPPADRARPAASPSPSPSPSLPPLSIRPAKLQVEVDGWWGWAMMDHRTGKISGSTTMTETSTTASLIKAWLAADFLRRATEQGVKPSKTRMDQISIMIRDSDNTSAQQIFRALGQTASIERLIDICKLTDSSSVRGYWSNTRLSPRDVTRLGLCIADGRAAGPQWTPYLLEEMRAVRGAGNFGVRRAFPAGEQGEIAIKNGWVTRENEGNWHVNCLAIGEDWSVGVMMRYPVTLGFEYGTKVCLAVGEQLQTV